MAVKTQTGHLPRRVKFFYGAGDTGFSLLYTMLDFFFLKYLLDVVQLSPVLAAGAIFAGRSWDWINDPLVGFLSDRIHTRWGRRRPFILFGTVPFALSFLLLWWIPPIGNQVGLAVYYGLAYFVFDALATLVSVPYYALTPEMTSDYDERTSLNAYRMSFSIVAGLIAYAPLLVLDRFSSAQVGFMVMAAIFGVISAGPLFGVYAVARERPEYRSGAGGSGMGNLLQPGLAAQQGGLVHRRADRLAAAGLGGLCAQSAPEHSHSLGHPLPGGTHPGCAADGWHPLGRLLPPDPRAPR